MKSFLVENTFKLPPNEVHLWHCRFDANKAYIEDFKRMLSDDEVEKASRFKFDIHREQSIISRGLLRTLLGRYLQISPNNLRFGYTEFDRPFLKEKTSLEFNVSHSGNRLVIGFVQNVEIGVDIEKLKSDFDVMAIAQSFFSLDEIETLNDLPDENKVDAFYRCWTRKESFIKAKGSGLSFPLTSFSVSLNTDTAKLLRTDWDTREKEEWQIFTFTPQESYQGAISVRSPISDVRQMDWLRP